MKNLKEAPNFKNEDEEREFWANHDSTEYIDWNNAVNAKVPNLKPTMRTISIRFPETLLFELKTVANKIDVPYQSLIKVMLEEKLRENRAFAK